VLLLSSPQEEDEEEEKEEEEGGGGGFNIERGCGMACHCSGEMQSPGRT
jgi:hypothetical protein